MKKLTVVATVDDRMGVAFNKRRQSRDVKLIEDLIRSTDRTIYVTEYSEPLFEGHIDRIIVAKDPMSECPDGGVCFIELTPLAGKAEEISTLILYRWNKVYPSDKKLGIDIDDSGFKLTGTTEFSGKSHDKITKEVYVK